MFFLMNDLVLRLEFQLLTPPMAARRFSALKLVHVERLGREIFAGEPRLQHCMIERARKLAGLIVSKAPEVNAALFAAPTRGCQPEHVTSRLASLDLQLLGSLHQEQQAGRLTPVLVHKLVWARASAA